MKKKIFVRLCAVVAILLLAGASGILISRLRAQQSAGRIASEIDDGARMTIPGTRSPRALRTNDIGRVAPETQLHGLGIVFNRSAQQEAGLQALIAAQQNPASPFYHQWLTPDEFGTRFGMIASDLTKVEAWLQEQGFSLDGISRSRNRINFSGTAGQVQSAFGTELHYYSINGKIHFAPSSDLSVPAALAPVVLNVTNLSDFRPTPRFRRPRANFTSSQSGHTFLTPKDVATVYDVNPAYTAGFTGKGQSIAVVGQTSVAVSDVENFENAAGLPVKDPTLLLRPGSGNVAEFLGDESESDLDLEYSGGMAPGASIIFVYVGDSGNFTVFDSIIYAIDNDLAPIISDSYGLCEPALSPGEYNTLNAVLAQGAVQGQSIMVPTGDSGSPDCEGLNGFSAAQQEQLAIDFPASSQYVTAMGGSEFLAADVCNLSTCSTPPPAFWQPAVGNNDVISSALQYIPEQVWNDDFPPSGANPAFLSSTGGGISTLTARPTWQATLPGPGIVGTTRLVPDIALSGSPQNAGFLYCSSDSSLGVTGSCSHGFRDANSSNLTVAGGTSFDAPMFSGLVAVINQKENSVGQGVVSPTLYQLASNAATYASAFHDIKTGNNGCSAAGATVCAGQAATQYAAGTGYDLASGLGSIDFANLLAAWPALAGSSLTPSRITLSAATNSPAIGANDAITITVTPGSGSSTPTGTVKVVVDGTTTNPSLALNTNYNFVPAVNGSHAITVRYSGDVNFAPSVATLVLDNQSFRLTATNPTITSGSAGSSAVTITPQEGYTGSISWVVSSNPALANGCVSLANASVPNSTTPVTASLSIKTNSAACGGSAMLRQSAASNLVAAAGRPGSISPMRRVSLGLAMAGLVLGGLFTIRPGKMRSTTLMLLLLALTLGLPACGGGSSGGGGANVVPGTYNLTVVGTDTTTSTISASDVVTVTVQ